MSYPPSAGQAAAGPEGGSREGGGEALAALGRRLRQARENRGLQPGDLAERLRIGVEQLEALESADRTRLPEPVFVIAQARRVAGALELDISADLAALRASGELAPAAPRGPRPAPLPGPADRVAAAEQRPAEGLPGRTAPPSGVRARPLLLLAAGLLLALAAAGAVLRLRLPAATDQAAPARGVLPEGGTSRSQPPVSAVPDNRAAAAVGQAGRADGAVAAGMVVLESREPSWVEVRRSDGVIVFRGLLRGARLFPLGDGLQLLAGRPDLVTTRMGRDAAQSLGPISEVRWRALPSGR